MSRFDDVRAINIAHKNFDPAHNHHFFQSKSLDCTGSGYCIFNGVLYQETDNQEIDDIDSTIRHEFAVPMDYSGTLNIYDRIQSGSIVKWIEYDLIFEGGRLIDVSPYPLRILEDKRDISRLRPGVPHNRVEVTISLNGCDEATQCAVADAISEETLDAIRQLIGQSNATIFYPVRRSDEHGLAHLFYPVFTIGSYVQSLSDLKKEGDVNLSFTAPSGEKIKFIMDEFSYYSK